MKSVESKPGVVITNLNRLHDFIITTPRVISLPTSLLWFIAASRLVGENYFLPVGEAVIPSAVIAGTLGAVGRIADTLSTVRVIRTVDFTKVGGPEELNPLLPKQPSEKQILAKKLTAIDALSVVIGTAIPPMGIGLGVGSISAAVTNELIRRHEERKLKRSNHLSYLRAYSSAVNQTGSGTTL